MSRTRSAAVGLLACVLSAGGAAAQTPPAEPQQGESAGAPKPAAPQESTRPPSGGVVLNPYAPPNPTAAAYDTGPIGGGNATESSARARVGDETDGFDLLRPPGGDAMHGDENGPIFSTSPGRRPGHVRLPGVGGVHVVVPGDTLWDICDLYFHNPYAWPRVWSYNPEIRNPHWIYPGDRVRLYAPAGGERIAAPSEPELRARPVDRPLRGGDQVVHLQDQGYLEDGSDEDWGWITGSPEDQTLLSEGDYVYLHVDGARDVHTGQTLTVFRKARRAPGGSIIAILGAVRIDRWNPRDRVARAQIIDSLDVIERGARIGPIPRTFELTPPVPNKADVEARVAASTRRLALYSPHQLVFVDRGTADGLAVGNRLFVVRRGDAWRRSLVAGRADDRIAPDSEKYPELEKTPGPGKDEAKYPDEVIGELRVVAARRRSATCLVTQAKGEIEPGDRAVARKGY